jgi:hypothetical protein
MRAAYEGTEAAEYRVHFPENALNVSIAQLADPSFATALQIARVDATQQQIDGCLNVTLAKLDRLAPAFSPIFRRAEAATEDDLVALAQHRLTWGEAARRRRDRTLAGQTEILAVRQRIAAADAARGQALTNTLATLAIVNAATQEAQRPVFAPLPTK